MKKAKVPAIKNVEQSSDEHRNRLFESNNPQGYFFFGKQDIEDLVIPNPDSQRNTERSKIRKSSKKVKKSGKQKKKVSDKLTSQTSRHVELQALGSGNKTAYHTERDIERKGRVAQLELDQTNSAKARVLSGINTCRNSSNPNPNESITSYIKNILKFQAIGTDKKNLVPHQRFAAHNNPNHLYKIKPKNRKNRVFEAESVNKHLEDQLDLDFSKFEQNLRKRSQRKAEASKIS